MLLLTAGAAGVMSQGRLMLAGGAGESEGGWSDAPYRWVVENAPNGRIGIISYSSDQTDWIPNYFKSLGAAEARYFIIPDRITADRQELYESLITCDGIFIKGGDQSIYYERYRGTRTEEALQHIYDRGGVLSGTSAGTVILSPVIYTAQVASVDPGQALLHAYSSQITLAGDFLETFSVPYIYDTHFVERGRFGRLPSFMATWFRETGQLATGIGIDDHTAICIDTSGMATIYGTGAVSFLKTLDQALPFDTTREYLRTGQMEVTQLLHGNRIDLKDGSVSGLEETVIPPLQEENRRVKVLFSGSDYPSETAFRRFADLPGLPGDTILIITGSSLQRAEDIATRLSSLNVPAVEIIQAVFGSGEDPEVRKRIDQAGKWLFVSNSYYDLMGFLQATENGNLLKEKLFLPGSCSFFVGDNARFAGRTVVENYRESRYTSYRGLLDFQPGLGLLQTTAWMPNAFLESDFYENTVSGLPYAMLLDSLRFGFYLTGNTVAEYGYTSEGQAYITCVGGSFPLVSLENTGTKTGFADQGPYATSRNVAGFSSMKLRYMGAGDSLMVGSSVPLSRMEYIWDGSEDLYLQLYQENGFLQLRLHGHTGPVIFRLMDMSGRVVVQRTFREGLSYDLRSHSPGVYVVGVARQGAIESVVRRKILHGSQ